MRSLIGRSLQAFGLAATLVGLVVGIAARSMAGEISMLLVGSLSFLAGRTVGGGGQG